MRKDDKSDHFQTTDLAQATFLNCTGHHCEVIPSDQAGRVLFRFHRSDTLGADLARFASGEGKIAPTVYEYMRRDLLRQVKSITSEIGGGRR